ncbi:MAG: Rho-binding antiterminator [Cyclobacteriaceae bacterium]
MTKEPYTPIDCNFYDRLEAWATKKAIVKIDTTTNGVLTGIIQDLYIDKKVEYLKLSTGDALRLDGIKSVNGIPLDGSSQMC